MAVCLCALLLPIAWVPAVAQAAAQQQSCTSGEQWQVTAEWGATYSDTRGVQRTRLEVGWTSTGNVLTEWEVRSYNGDSSVTGTLRGQTRHDYGTSTKQFRVDAHDPTGAGAQVRVRVGAAMDGKADCLLHFTAPTSAPAPAQPEPEPASNLLFVDDFTGPAGQSFDRTKWQDWSACTYHSSAAFGNIRCGDTESLDGQGHLKIPASPTAGSAISTAGKFDFVYGEVSAWIKVPAQDGYWPAFWTLNAEQSCCAAKTLPVGELDIMEQYTTWDTLYHRAVHNWNGDRTWHGGDAVCGNVDLTAGFHKYTVRVEPSRLTFFFDDQQCGRTITPDLGDGKPYAFGPGLMDPNFLILDLAVGGASGQQNPATQPAVMLVDRVEVRSL